MSGDEYYDHPPFRGRTPTDEMEWGLVLMLVRVTIGAFVSVLVAAAIACWLVAPVLPFFGS